MTSDEVVDLLFYGGLATFLGWLAWTLLKAKRLAAEHSRALESLAADREWTFREEDRGLMDKVRAANVVSGRHSGRGFTAFEYSFTTTHGERTDTHLRAVVAVDLGGHSPGLSVARAGSGDTAAERLVDPLSESRILVGHSTFDTRFDVTSPSALYARDFLVPAVMDVALRRPELAWQLHQSQLKVVREGNHTPDDLDATLRFVDTLLDVVPDYFRAQLLGDPPR